MVLFRVIYDGMVRARFENLRFGSNPVRMVENGPDKVRVWFNYKILNSTTPTQLFKIKYTISKCRRFFNFLE